MEIFRKLLNMKMPCIFKIVRHNQKKRELNYKQQTSLKKKVDFQKKKYMPQKHYYLNLVESKTAPPLFTRSIVNLSTVNHKKNPHASQLRNFDWHNFDLLYKQIGLKETNYVDSTLPSCWRVWNSFSVPSPQPNSAR